MHDVTVLSLATGVPAYQYTQEQVADYLLAHSPISNRQRAVHGIFQRAGVSCRNFAIEASFYDDERSTQERNDLYMERAVPLGEATIRDALSRADLRPSDIDDLIVVSCTGFNIPGLDLRLASRLGMRPDLHRTCVLGMGCYGAFPGMLRAHEAARQGRVALVLALELCSLHMQFDGSTESVVSTSLFADGAAAIILGQSADSGLRPRLVDFNTHCDYQTLEHMAFTVTNHGFRMYLSSYVPDLLAADVGHFADALLARNGLQRDDVTYWGIHPGSKRIVDYVGDELGLAPAQVAASHGVLNDYGNMSSPTVLFVLERLMQQAPPPGSYGVLMAFGPGLTMESALVQW